jgi:hypothetical protein
MWAWARKRCVCAWVREGVRGVRGWGGCKIRRGRGVAGGRWGCSPLVCPSLSGLMTNVAHVSFALFLRPAQFSFVLFFLVLLIHLSISCRLASFAQALGFLLSLPLSTFTVMGSYFCPFFPCLRYLHRVNKIIPWTPLWYLYRCSYSFFRPRLVFTS